MKTVYTEIFIIDNILINYCFLYLSGAILRIKIRRYSGIIAALLGALYAYCQLGGHVYLANPVLKALLSAAMIYLSYRPLGTAFFKLIFCFYSFSFIFAGAILALFYTTLNDSFLRSVFYLPIPMRFAVFIMISCSFIKKNILLFISRLTYTRTGITLQLLCFNTTVTLSCYSDTGNCCTYFGKPVAFVNKRHLPLDDETKSILSGNIPDTLSHINIVYIPYKAAGGVPCTAPGFKCENAVVSDAKTVRELCIYIALTDHDFDGEPCLINPTLLD